MAKNKLYYYRREKGLRQHQLAERLGISELYVSRIETGRTVPAAELLEKISEILGVGVDEIFPKSIKDVKGSEA